MLVADNPAQGLNLVRNGILFFFFFFFKEMNPIVSFILFRNHKFNVYWGE